MAKLDVIETLELGTEPQPWVMVVHMREGSRDIDLVEEEYDKHKPTSFLTAYQELIFCDFDYLCCVNEMSMSCMVQEK